MEDSNNTKAHDLLTKEELEALKELLKQLENGDLTEKEIDAVMKKLEKYLTKDQIDRLLKKMRTKIWGTLTDREKAEILGNLPPA